ncbi:MAG: thiamine diphosphokinase, partial [Simkaniaceae bacterium]|nr:thiamine diphosphokinase [Simkaniaceae bacterium]
MKYALFVNGQLSTRPNLGDEWIVVAVDGGMRHVDRADVVVGDLDSIESVPDCEVVKYPREKDETDLELALAWVKDQGGKIVRIYGALGGRVDHEMANIFLMGDERWKELDLVMLDGTTEVRVL